MGASSLAFFLILPRFSTKTKAFFENVLSGHKKRKRTGRVGAGFVGYRLSSTRSRSRSQAWVTASSLRYSGVPVHFISCGKGLKPCLLSVGRGGESLCSSCMELSREMYDGLPHTVFGYEQDNEVANDVEGLDHAGLSAYVHEGVPLGELTLPSLRWILRKHHLDNDPEAVTLQRSFIRSAWSTYL